MVFLDEAVITARSGNGGKGCVSFRREKFVPKGGPDGGNGGDGGSIIIRATKRLYTLRDFSRRRYFKAGNGGTGKGKSQSGRNSPHCIIETPVGTIIQDDESGEVLADLIEDNPEIVLISGGKGGNASGAGTVAVVGACRIRVWVRIPVAGIEAADDLTVWKGASTQHRVSVVNTVVTNRNSHTLAVVCQPRSFRTHQWDALGQVELQLVDRFNRTYVGVVEQLIQRIQVHLG